MTTVMTGFTSTFVSCRCKLAQLLTVKEGANLFPIERIFPESFSFFPGVKHELEEDVWIAISWI